MRPAPAPRPEEESRDLGFGAVVAESRQRLLNPDGTFNVRRQGLPPGTSLSLYHWLLTLSWPRFLALFTGGYLALNAIFATVFWSLGPGAIETEDLALAPWWRDFFFSVQTFSTIGYGHVHPFGMAANLVVTVEALFGLLGFTLATGILFARFSRPTAKILFSRHALVAPYRGGTSLQFRIANARRSEVVELAAEVVLSRFEGGMRRFHRLALERERVTFFPLSWTLVHPIDERSPLWNLGPAELAADDAEILVLLAGFDEGFSQTVHARSSYRAADVVWNARFLSVFEPARGDGVVRIDVGRLSRFERLAEPAP